MKLESIRPGRTRYLVVVSRPVKRNKHMSHPSSTASHHISTSLQQVSTNSHHHLNPRNKLQPCTTSITTSTSSAANNQSEEMCGSCTTDQQMYKNDDCNDKNCDSINKNLKFEIQKQQQKTPPSTLPLEHTTTSIMIDLESLHNISGDTNFEQTCFNCRKNSSMAVELKTKVDNEEEVEESCLLGIDCNEETTVGLVLRVLADTTIRLDGDG